MVLVQTNFIVGGAAKAYAFASATGLKAMACQGVHIIISRALSSIAIVEN